MAHAVGRRPFDSTVGKPRRNGARQIAVACMNTDNWITAVLALRKAKRVVVFTGAGISADSGVPTFRDAGGFWQRFPPERFATWRGLLETALTEPRSVAEFVLNVVEPIAKAEANPGHLALVQLERRVATAIVTQNIDGLHQSAGSRDVLEIHGSLVEIVDVSSGQLVRRIERNDLLRISDALGRYIAKELSLFSLIRQLRRSYPLDWRGRHRPNLVLFGDALAEPAWTKACQAVRECDVLLSVGTSGEVYPAAMLPAEAAGAGATVILVDPRPGEDCWLEGTAAGVLPKLMSDAFGSPRPNS